MIVSNNYERDMVFNVLMCKPNAAEYTRDLGKISKLWENRDFNFGKEDFQNHELFL